MSFVVKAIFNTLHKIDHERDRSVIFKGIILTSCAKINGERTIQSIYHLLTGKRSIQTVLDAHLYGLDHLYGIHRQLSLQSFNKIVADLMRNHYIRTSHEDKVYLLTDRGKKWLATHKKKLKLSSFQGFTYNRMDSIFYARLILFIQVLVNQRMQHTAYIPVVDQPSITNWVKKTYKYLYPNLDRSVHELYRELHQILSTLSNLEADLFVNRLTGYKQVGLSIQQLAQLYQMSGEDIQLVLMRIIHQMISIIYTSPSDYQMMSLMLRDLTKINLLTNSANETYKLFKKGYNLQQIATIRQLKMNTIQDHIVEIALYDQTIPIDQFVSDQAKTEIIQAIHQVNSTKLKTIKQHVGEKISYFQIRLVLTRYIR